MHVLYSVMLALLQGVIVKKSIRLLHKSLTEGISSCIVTFYVQLHVLAG